MVTRFLAAALIAAVGGSGTIFIGTVADQGSWTRTGVFLWGVFGVLLLAAFVLLSVNIFRGLTARQKPNN